MSKPEQPFAPVNLPPKPRVATKRVADPEIQAMSRIGEILNELPEETRQRVLDWVNDRYRPKWGLGSKPPVDGEEPS